MAKIILFGNQKGGIGKSTLTILTANALASPEFDYKILVIDNDMQRSVASIRAYDKEALAQDEKFEFPYDVRSMTYPQIKNTIVELDKMYDFIFIDTPGRIDTDVPTKDQEITKLLSFADFVFVPFKGGALNLDSTLRYAKLLLDIQALRKKQSRTLKIYGLVNFYRQQAITDQELQEEIDYLQSNTSIEFMKAKLKQHALFERLDTYKSIYLEGISSNKARKNFSIWFDEFLRIVL